MPPAKNAQGKKRPRDTLAKKSISVAACQIRDDAGRETRGRHVTLGQRRPPEENNNARGT